MSEVADIETAPKDGSHVLLFGLPRGGSGEVTFSKPLWLSGYWDDIDSAWCATTSDWTGPFIDATHWAALPSRPVAAHQERGER